MNTRWLVITVALTVLSVLAAFVVPHHAYPEHSSKPRTLWEIVRPVFGGDLPHGTGPLLLLFAMIVLGAFAAAYPALLVPVLRTSLTDVPRAASPYLHREWLIIAGVLALLGAAINLLVILVSEMSFGFGVSTASADRTFGFAAIPLLHAIVAVLSLVIGASPAAARLAAHIMTAHDAPPPLSTGVRPLTTPRTSSAAAATLDPRILNETLDLALEWGEQFLKPTQPRVAKLHPELREDQLNAYDAAARVVMKTAFDMFYANPDADGQALAKLLHADHPWVNASNLARLHTQGMYYAHK